MAKHIIDPNTITVPANMRLAEGRTALDYPKRLECKVVIHTNTLETMHYFQVIVDGSREFSSAWLTEAVEKYNSY